MKRALREGFRNIPEGEQVVLITKIDDEGYQEFGKITVHIEDATGATARENFNFTNNDGTPNDIAESKYSRMCRAAMDDQTLDECDTDDLIGKYVTVEIVHKEGSKGGTFANVNKWVGAAKAFKRGGTATGTPKKSPAASGATGSESAAPKKTAAEIIAEMRARKENSAG